MLASRPLTNRDVPARAAWWRAPFPGLLRAMVADGPPWFLLAALVLCALGYGIAFALVPVDPTHGVIHRIAYIHVPATWLALALYALLALCAAAERSAGARIAPRLVEAIAPTGALFAFLAFWTGSLWGKPVWGAWLVWDMRLVADIVLLLLYLAIAGIHVANPVRADRFAAVLALTGATIVPLMLVSIALWPVGHTGSAFQNREPVPLVQARSLAFAAIAAGFLCYSCATVLLRLRCVLFERALSSGRAEQALTA